MRKRDLIGRRIVDVDFRPFCGGLNGNRVDCTNPVITLDNGRRLYFLTQPTEGGEYGTKLILTKAKGAPSAT